MISQEAENRYRRARYASDPEYRQRRLDAARARKDEVNQRRKDRYRYDAGYRAKQIAAARAYEKRRSSGVGLSRKNEKHVYDEQSA